VTNVPGSASLALSCAGDADHNSWSGTGSITINAVAPTLTLSCLEVPYDGTAHSCTGSATGLGGVTVSGTWIFNPAAETTAASYPVTGTFTSTNADYTGGTASGTLKIDALAPTLTLTCTEVHYDGTAHSCTGSATGLGGVTVSGTWIFNPASETAVGSYPVTGTFTSTNADYTGGTATGTLKIDTVAVSSTTPVISNLTPIHIAAGSPAFTLTVSGTNFASTTVIEWAGTPLTTTYTAGTLSATVPAADVATTGTAAIKVVDPTLGTSLPFQFAIDTPSTSTGAITVTTSSTPVTVTAGQAASVTVALTNTGSSAEITAQCVNLPAYATCSYSSSTQTVTISTTASTPKGTYYVTVIFTSTSQTATLAHTRTFFAAWSGLLGLPLGLLWVGGGRKKALRRYLLILVGLLLLASLVGCGGKAQSSSAAVTTQASTGVTLTVQ
jgi:hypothetical protein